MEREIAFGGFLSEPKALTSLLVICFFNLIGRELQRERVLLRLCIEFLTKCMEMHDMNWADRVNCLKIKQTLRLHSRQWLLDGGLSSKPVRSIKVRYEVREIYIFIPEKLDLCNNLLYFCTDSLISFNRGISGSCFEDDSLKNMLVQNPVSRFMFLERKNSQTWNVKISKKAFPTKIVAWYYLCLNFIKNPWVFWRIQILRGRQTFNTIGCSFFTCVVYLIFHQIAHVSGDDNFGVVWVYGLNSI